MCNLLGYCQLTFSGIQLTPNTALGGALANHPPLRTTLKIKLQINKKHSHVTLFDFLLQTDLMVSGEPSNPLPLEDRPEPEAERNRGRRRQIAKWIPEVPRHRSLGILRSVFSGSIERLSLLSALCSHPQNLSKSTINGRSLP